MRRIATFRDGARRYFSVGADIGEKYRYEEL